MNIIMFKYKELMLLSFSLLLIQIACYIIIHTRTHTNTYFQMPNILQINWNIILFSLRYDWLDAQSLLLFCFSRSNKNPKAKKKTKCFKVRWCFFCFISSPTCARTVHMTLFDYSTHRIKFASIQITHILRTCVSHAQHIRYDTANNSKSKYRVQATAEIL